MAWLWEGCAYRDFNFTDIHTDEEDDMEWESSGEENDEVEVMNLQEEDAVEDHSDEVEAEDISDGDTSDDASIPDIDTYWDALSEQPARIEG